MKQVLPRIFIGSSTEGKKFASALKSRLNQGHTVTVWDQDIFRLGQSTLEGLVKMLDQYDFAIFVFSPDDEVTLRGQDLVATRDNVYFECGLFMGRLGRERTFFVRPEPMPNLRIPSDLLGITAVSFNHARDDGNWVAEFATAGEQIRNHIRELWIAKGYALSRHLQTDLSKPQTANHWLKRVMQSGYFCGIDEGFWMSYCERLDTNDAKLIAKRARMIAEARDNCKALIPPDDVYVLMQALFERVVKKTQLYCAIATEVDLRDVSERSLSGSYNDSASEKFLFDAPKLFPASVRRLFLIPSIESLQNLRPEQKRDLVLQVKKGAKLKVLFRKPREQDNFGVYGQIAVGTLDPETRWNAVNFNKREVDNRIADFRTLWDHPQAHALTPEMLSLP